MQNLEPLKTLIGGLVLENLHLTEEVQRLQRSLGLLASKATREVVKSLVPEEETSQSVPSRPPDSLLSGQ